MAHTVSLIVYEVFLAPRNALELATTYWVVVEDIMAAVVTHLAGLCIDDPTRDSDGCGLVHEASLCDDAQEGHGRHIESELRDRLPFRGCRRSDIVPMCRSNRM